jgi:Family of unknown function (DUF6065)
VMGQFLKIWRLHPNGARVSQAEKTLRGTANQAGVRWCVPYSTANRFGWWLWSPVDIDITWKGGKEFDHFLHTPYTSTEAVLVRSLVKNGDPDKWCPDDGGRTKFTFGAVDEGVVQIWTGFILQTPPGWCLHIRSPVNCDPQPYYVQEGILETDWMYYDIWINLRFTRENVYVHLRREQWPPLAQLIPVRRESTQEWELQEEFVNCKTPEAHQVFSYWVEYNRKKYESTDGKQLLSVEDPSLKKKATTFFEEKSRRLGKNIEPDPLPPKTVTRKKIKPFIRKEPD